MNKHVQIDESLKPSLLQMGRKAKEAQNLLRLASRQTKSDALSFIAKRIRHHASDIILANDLDMQKGLEKCLSPALLDRLKLNTERINAMANGLETIADLPDPVGQIDESWQQDNGLRFSKIRVPIGVIGIIYESRPNVTADAAGLCLWSGNSCILRGGSEAFHSNQAIYLAISQGLIKAGLPAECVQLIPTSERVAVGYLLEGLDETVDLIIPRGGKSLIQRVQTDARVPVLAHLEGLCHSYIHKDADIDKALSVVLNAKLRRVGICGATETLLMDEAISHMLPQLSKTLSKAGCEIRGCERALTIGGAWIKPASDEDFSTEHLAPILNLKIVDNIEDAMSHIAHYGSGHTDSILTENPQAAQMFLQTVDSAIVMHNASTQFADGGEFGFGAEIGIATGRLHARGPVGAQHLTTYKYTVQGDGHTRP